MSSDLLFVFKLIFIIIGMFIFFIALLYFVSPAQLRLNPYFYKIFKDKYSIKHAILILIVASVAIRLLFFLIMKMA